MFRREWFDSIDPQMTHLGKAINRLMLERPKLSAAEIARKTRVSPAYICRLRSGQRSGVSTEVLARLAKILTDSETERAELIAAHMKDESCGYYPRLIEIRIKSGNTFGNGSARRKTANKK
jgi:transcriptional regulator with XRE-family HTH domain